MARRMLFLQFTRMSPWKMALAGALGAVLLVSIFALALATFLVIAPIAAIGAAIGGWWMSRGVRVPAGTRRPGHSSVDPTARAPRQTGRSQIVDADYTVIEPGQGAGSGTGSSTGNVNAGSARPTPQKS